MAIHRRVHHWGVTLIVICVVLGVINHSPVHAESAEVEHQLAHRIKRFLIFNVNGGIMKVKENPPKERKNSLVMHPFFPSIPECPGHPPSRAVWRQFQAQPEPGLQLSDSVSTTSGADKDFRFPVPHGMGEKKRPIRGTSRQARRVPVVHVQHVGEHLGATRPRWPTMPAAGHL